MSIRADRLKASIQREISWMLNRGMISDSGLDGMITITEIKLSRDLQYAEISVSVMHGDAESSLAALVRASGYIRNQLGKRIRMRRTPNLRFKLDNSAQYHEEIERILDTLDIPPEKK
ncbi:30S ribosome-binding factor RbfA [Magnetococcales bacterium HHB-1]